MRGLNVEYSINEDYFEVGQAYKLKVNTSDYRIGILSDMSKTSVTFKILSKTDKANMIDYTITVEQMRRADYGIVKMIPDYKEGRYNEE